RLDPFPIWGSGEQTRNFTHVSDTVTGLALAGAALDGFSALNIGSSTHHTVLELCDEVFRWYEWTPEQIDRQLDRPVGVASRAADNSFCRTALGWEPEISLRSGVQRTAAWYDEALGAPDLGSLELLLSER